VAVNPCKQEPPGPKPFLPGLLKLQVQYTGAVPGPVRAANVLHARWNDNVNHLLADVALVCNHFQTHWVARMQGSIAGQYTMGPWTVQSLGGDGLISTLSNTAPGAGTGFPNPPQCAVCITWQSGIVARGGRGRTYLPGIPGAANVQAGSPALQSSYTGPLTTAANGFLNDMAADVYGSTGITIGIPSYYNKCAFRPVPLFFPIHAAVVHDRLDSQRRRSGKESSYPIG
jgi:hypothetical protein